MSDAKLIKTIEKLLFLGDGDLERLTRMKDQLKKDEELHPSDKKYLMSLVTDYLEPYEKYHSDDLAEYMKQSDKSPFEIEQDDNKKHRKKNMAVYVILVLITVPLWLYWNYTKDLEGVGYGLFSILLGTVYLILRFGWKKNLSHKLRKF